MIEMNLKPSRTEGLHILCIGAHCDDIEIGCGGTLLKLIARHQVAKIKWVVFASNEIRKMEAAESAAHFLKDVPQKEVEILSFRDAFLQFSALEIKEHFETIKRSFEPDVVFTHYRHDRHQDHRLLSDLAWNTFRAHLILEYEIPKYDGDLGQPNLYVELTKKQAQQKIDILLDSFKSQAHKHWFDAETFYSIMRLRAIESASQSKFAEAFYARKIKL